MQEWWFCFCATCCTCCGLDCGLCVCLMLWMLPHTPTMRLKVFCIVLTFMLGEAASIILTVLNKTQSWGFSALWSYGAIIGILLACGSEAWGVRSAAVGLAELNAAITSMRELLDKIPPDSEEDLAYQQLVDGCVRKPLLECLKLKASICRSERRLCRPLVSLMTKHLQDFLLRFSKHPS